MWANQEGKILSSWLGPIYPFFLSRSIHDIIVQTLLFVLFLSPRWDRCKKTEYRKVMLRHYKEVGGR
jgi:hypothetical protein